MALPIPWGLEFLTSSRIPMFEEIDGLSETPPLPKELSANGRYLVSVHYELPSGLGPVWEQDSKSLL